MSNYDEYKRYFIILQEDTKGYSVSQGKTPAGYVKIEIKNNISKVNVFVQNIKSDKDIEYKIVLAAPAKNTGISIGRIIVDKNGRGDLTCELPTANILDSGCNISEFVAAFVCHQKSFPLSGYIGKEKIDWKKNVNIINERQEAPKSVEVFMEEVGEKQEIIARDKEIKEEKIEEIVEEEQIVEEPIVEEEIVEQEIEEPEEIIEQPVEEEIIVEEKIEEIVEQEIIVEEKRETCEDSIDYTKLNKYLKCLRRFKPFGEDECMWFYVDCNIKKLSKVMIKCQGETLPMIFPFTQDSYYMINHNSYIIGIKYDHEGRCIKYLIYGIPGKYNTEQKRLYKSLGFRDYKKECNTSNGYYLMYFDLDKCDICDNLL